MNKKEKITSLKSIKRTAADLIEVSRQNLHTAMRLKSEAEVALEVLGAPKGQPQKGKFEFTEKEKLALKASLTK